MKVSFMVPKERAAKAVLISVTLHLAAAAILLSKPLYLQHHFWGRIGKAPSLFLEEEQAIIVKRNRALDEAFSQLDFAESKKTYPSLAPLKTAELETPPDYESLPPFQEMSLALPSFNPASMPYLPAPPFREESLTLVQPPSLTTFRPEVASSFTPFSLKKLDLSEYTTPLLPPARSEEVPLAFDFIPSQEERQLDSLPLAEVPLAEYSQSPSLGAPVICETPSEKISVAFSDFAMTPAQPASITHQQTLTSLSEYGLPSLHLKEWNELFNADVKMFTSEEGEVLFSVHLIPRQDLSEYRLKQNYLFVIDRSNSVDKHQYQTFKRAVSRAVSALREGDNFNILLLDATVTRLSDQPLPFTKAHQRKAEEFLEKEAHGHYGAATDIYSILTKMIMSTESPTEAITAILISDGDSPLKSNQQRKKINQWLEANQDRITLYTATAGHGNNLSTLKMLGLASRGSLLYSDTYAAFPRKLAKLVMDLRYPLAKEMNLSFTASDPSIHLELLPPSSRLPYLFSDHPFTLIGKCNKPVDFTLVLEGKNKDQILTIKKTISLSKAKPGSRLLAKQWAAEKAHLLFDQYLREGESSLLKQAEEELRNGTKNSRR